MAVINELNRVEILTLQDNYISFPPVDPVVGGTIAELAKIAPRYIVPTYCTGRRKSIQLIEEAMPDAFILNMSGTRLTFAA